MRKRVIDSFQRQAALIGLHGSDKIAYLSTTSPGGGYLVSFVLVDERTVRMKWSIGAKEVVEEMELKQFKRLNVSHINYLGYFIESTQVQYNHAKLALDQIAPQTALAARYALEINV
jgi:hypothetical protein